MWAGLRFVLFATIIVATPAHAWQAVEKKEPYKIQGSTGIELYRSIGEHGPKVGVGRAVAYTTFDLKWSRKYVPQNGGCTLVSAKPHLTIIYKLPKPAKQLPPATQALWDSFIAGIEAHERVHGETILDMVRKIEAVSIGLTVDDDPDCKKIRTELTRKLKTLSEEQRARGREFDKVEMSQGGNVHRLILALVNG